GIRRGWVSRAMVWSSTTKRLIKQVEPGEAMLAMVAFYLCLKDVRLLIEGIPQVPLEPAMRKTCPVDVKDLKKLEDRLRLFRNEVLHLSTKTDDGREFRFNWSADPPHFTYASTVGNKKFEWDSITRPEIETLLAHLDPWLHDHWERMINEERGERDQD